MEALDAKLRDFKQSYLVGEHRDVTKTLSTIGWYYKVGSFKINVDIVEVSEISWMRSERYLTCTIADQIFMAKCLKSQDKWESPELHGILYDHYFPDLLTVQFFDEKHMSKNNDLENGYLGKIRLSEDLRQSNLTIGSKLSIQFSMSLSNVQNKSEKISVSVSIEYNYKNEPVAKDKDVTEFFRSSMKAAAELCDKHAVGSDKKFRKCHAGLEAIHVILVPGLFTGAYPGYFDENVKALEKLDIHHSIAPIKSEDPVDSNAAVLRDYVRTIYEKHNGVKIILMCHSKGGCDALEAIYNDPTHRFRKMIYGVINMQSPIAGTPMVEWLKEGGGVGNAAKSTAAFLDKMFKMNATGAIMDLGLETRNSYLEKIYAAGDQNRFSIPDQTGVYFLSFCCFADFGESNNIFEAVGKVSMGVTNLKIEATGHRSDGLVPLQSGRVPGGEVILIDNAYHTTPALHMKGNSYHSGHLTIALLNTFLNDHPIDMTSKSEAHAIGEGLKAATKEFNQEVPGYLPTDENTPAKTTDYISPKYLSSKLKGKFIK